MSSKNKFGLGPFSAEVSGSRRERTPGPMGAAVRETAENLQETTDAKVEQRRKNTEDAKAYRAAQEEGRVLMQLPVGNISTDELPRDRIALDSVAHSDEMEELKASIRARGQQEPIEVFIGADGSYQLKKGWRRLTALLQLHSETGDDAFANAIARVEVGQGDRMSRYVDMVEENVVREDLTFAEMAQVAIKAAEDSQIDECDPAALVNRLYGSLHKVKRSYIRSFVTLMVALGEDLRWPKAVARNLGVDVSRAVTNSDQIEELRAALKLCASAEEQTGALQTFLQSRNSAGAKRKATPKQKFEFFVGETKVTARNRECRIVSKSDFTSIDRDRLERAVQAFEREIFRSN